MLGKNEGRKRGRKGGRNGGREEEGRKKEGRRKEGMLEKNEGREGGRRKEERRKEEVKVFILYFQNLRNRNAICQSCLSSPACPSDKNTTKIKRI